MVYFPDYINPDFFFLKHFFFFEQVLQLLEYTERQERK